MDNNPVQQGLPNNKPKLAFLALIILLLGFILGFGVNHFFFKKPQNAITNAQPLAQKIDESKLPISLSILQNPLVYEWQGSIQGKVIAKNQHTFTLEDNQGNKITITDKSPSGDVFNTKFYQKSDSKWKEATLSAVSIGDDLRGGFFIFKGGKNTPVGSVFWIEK